MIDWLSKKQREEKHKEAQELELRNSLAQKVSQYENSRIEPADDSGEQDFTELLIDGKKLRVEKEEITLSGT